METRQLGGSDLRVPVLSFGTATFVTGTFGFVAAAHVVQHIAAELKIQDG